MHRPASLSLDLSDPVPDARPDEPSRVIEVAGAAAGIAVPEGRGVRFFSASRAFDGLDGAVFGSAAQAARAARERARHRGRVAVG